MPPGFPDDPGNYRDTEAGRLLSKLYATATKPVISYPKPKLKPRRPEDTPAFMPAGGKADVDYRTATRKEGTVAVPRVGSDGKRVNGFHGNLALASDPVACAALVCSY